MSKSTSQIITDSLNVLESSTATSANTMTPVTSRPLAKPTVSKSVRIEIPSKRKSKRIEVLECPIGKIRKLNKFKHLEENSNILLATARDVENILTENREMRKQQDDKEKRYKEEATRLEQQKNAAEDILQDVQEKLAKETRCHGSRRGAWLKLCLTTGKKIAELEGRLKARDTNDDKTKNLEKELKMQKRLNQDQEAELKMQKKLNGDQAAKLEEYKKIQALMSKVKN
ncbi:hypothetical protein EJ04DRAFT_518111 [Polyplosphaeria fusca]|uniref:Uncharacterized protein n=1 Tax=Polyplosphaeria fusca TaxID=682080 RepID=A0A9P4RCE6_9PLEO|nr:hypothetical protein EJ04DRAFT_518111 [Polyplosphaeria fusca]